MALYADNRQRGFTLVEIVIALLLISVAALSLLSMISYSSRMSVKVQNRTMATEIAESIIEQTKSSMTTSEDFNTLSGSGYLSTGSTDDFIYDIDVSSVNPDIKYLAVSIYYRDKKSSSPKPDTGKGTSGRILRLGTYLSSP
ncbi:MAG: prepilin-type N-terminal cleavage/methylation domain-containing protein [Candidatus Xenobiia bacterium LiM19]